MPKTQRPEDLGSVITGILGRLHKLEWSRSSGAGGLIPTANDGTNIFASDINVTIPFDGVFHLVTWSDYSGMPAWATVGGSEQITMQIVEPGMYLVAPTFEAWTDPTSAGLVLRTLGEPFLQDTLLDIDALQAAFALGGPVTPATEVAVLTAADLPWSFTYRVIGTADDTCEVKASVYLQQLAHL